VLSDSQAEFATFSGIILSAGVSAYRTGPLPSCREVFPEKNIYLLPIRSLIRSSIRIKCGKAEGRYGLRTSLGARLEKIITAYLMRTEKKPPYPQQTSNQLQENFDKRDNL
jgi:hypothetical protein